MDNATNNDTMLTAIERRCHEVGIKFSAADARGRCMPHTIHLAAIRVSLDYLYHQHELLTVMNIQLLEESGAISQADAKASSQAVNYQDAMPDLELVLFEDDDDPASKDDEPEDPASPFEVDMSAIGRVH